MSRRERGTTLLELAIASGLFTLLVAILFVALKTGLTAWRTAEARHAAQFQLRKVELKLLGDVRRSSYADLTAAPTAAAAGAGGGFDGGVLWFRSSVDRASGESIRDDQGVPTYQSTIVYFLAKPDTALHLSRHGQDCQDWGGADATNADESCPHKLLVRLELQKQAHAPPEYGPSEAPFTAAELAGYIKRPADYVLSNINGGELIRKEIIGDSLLYFRPTKAAGTVTFDIDITRIADARKKISIGGSATSLRDSPFTYNFTAAAVPGNE